MGKRERLVLLTGDRPEHRYLANHLVEEFSSMAILVDEGRAPARPVRRKPRAFTEKAGKGVLKICRRLFRTQERFREDLIRTLGLEKSGSFLRPDLVQRIQEVNSPATVELINQLKPDRILVYGTAVVQDHVLKLSPLAPLNMHTGISPYYRGSSCYFWPVHNQELDRLGATVHECIRRIDGGAIYATGQAVLEPEDNSLGAIFGRCVQVGAELYRRVLKDLENGTAQCVPQDLSKGFEYRAPMRGVFAEFRVHRLLKQGIVQQWVERKRGERTAD